MTGFLNDFKEIIQIINEDLIKKPILYTLYYFIPTYQVYLQFVLIILVLWMIFKKTERSRTGYPEEVEDDLIQDWAPKPLVDPYEIPTNALQRKIVDKKIGKYIIINGKKCLNVASNNLLGLLDNSNTEELTINAVRKYGVGSCGPRGFYGTVDVHLQLEKEIAEFLGMEEALVYSCGFSALASAIPAYGKRSDIIYADEMISYAIQKGLIASRSQVVFFRHNDYTHLEELLTRQAEIDLKNKKKVLKMKKFLVLEGIYKKSGQICNLPEFMKLKNKYCLRLFIDETISLGTLGSTGRGITEHFNVSVNDLDLIMGSMEYSFSSVGGFCAGQGFIIEHQRLSGLGYCFSASLPPLLTVAAMANLKAIDEDETLVQRLKISCKTMHYNLLDSKNIQKYFNICGDILSPLKFLVPKIDKNAHQLITNIVGYCFDNDIAICESAYLNDDKQEPSIVLTISNTLTKEDIENIVKIIEEGVIQFYERKKMLSN